MVELVVSSGHDVVECLVTMGLYTLYLENTYRYKPIVTRQESPNLKAKWNFKDYIKLGKPTEAPSFKAQAAAIKGDVVAEIERGGCAM